MIDKLGSMKLDQLSKYVSPELAEGTTRKSGLARFNKMTSNLIKQINVKLLRIENWIKGGDWINDNKVANKIIEKLVNLTNSIINLDDKTEYKKSLCKTRQN
jgi:hypothetical protein